MQKSQTPAYFDHLNSLNNGVTAFGCVSRNNGPVFIIEVEGFLDNENSKVFMNSVLNVLREQESKYTTVILDLGKLTYLSSTGVGTFNNIMLQMQDLDKKFYLMNVEEKIKSVLKLLGLYSFFEIYEGSEI
jgi:anti-anti-sigma factor